MSIIGIVIYLLVLVVIYVLIDYVLKAVPVPDPPARIIRIVVVVIFCLIVINILLRLAGVSTGVGLPGL